MSKTITVGADGYIDILEFKDFVDVDKVYYYRFKANKDKSLTLKLYDKNKKLIKPGKKA